MKKKILALLLALACGLLAGCAPAAEPDAERIDVCVCVHTEDAAIYYDTAEQVLLDEAVYPETIPDAQSAYSGISFDDLNADAQGDIRMTFLHEDGTQTVLVWYWDAEGGYVYQPDCSALHAPGEKA